MQQMKRLYHYTRATNLSKISKAGQIQPATEFVYDTRERPVVWLSFAPDWEPTATPMRSDFTPLSFEEFAKIETPMRIEVDPAKYRLGWRAFVKMSGCKPKSAKSLKRTAEEAGSSVVQWRISFEPIPDCDWLKVEGFIDGQWKEALQRPDRQGG
jgi:hypothetical protein